MFGLLDALESECVRNGPRGAGPGGPIPDVISEELRLRVYKLVAGKPLVVCWPCLASLTSGAAAPLPGVS